MQKVKEYIKCTIGHIFIQIGAKFDLNGMKYAKIDLYDQIFYNHKTIYPFKMQSSKLNGNKIPYSAQLFGVVELGKGVSIGHQVSIYGDKNKIRIEEGA